MKEHPVFQQLPYQNLVDIFTRAAQGNWRAIKVIGLYHDDVMKIEPIEDTASSRFGWIDHAPRNIRNPGMFIMANPGSRARIRGLANTWRQSSEAL